MAVMIVWLIFIAFKKRILNSSDSFGSFSHPVTFHSSPVQRPNFVMQLVCSGNVGIDDYTRFNKEAVTSLGQSDFTSFVMTLENLLYKMKILFAEYEKFLPVSCLLHCFKLIFCILTHI